MMEFPIQSGECIGCDLCSVECPTAVITIAAADGPVELAAAQGPIRHGPESETGWAALSEYTTESLKDEHTDPWGDLGRWRAARRSESWQVWRNWNPYGTAEGTLFAPCQEACPVGTDAGRYVALVGEGRYAEALGVAAEYNPFPSVCGRVCTAPCEPACPCSVTALRAKKGEGDEPPWHARPNFRFRGVDWPLFAVFGGTATGLAWLVVVVQDAPTRYAGLGWLIAGFIFYPLYRRHLGEPLRVTVRAPVVIMGAELEYRSILVPLAPGYPSSEAMDIACRLSRERGSRIVAMTVIEVPLDLPLDAYLPEQVEAANQHLDEARAIGDSYGVNVVARIIRARNAGRAVTDEAVRRGFLRSAEQTGPSNDLESAQR